MWYFIINNLIKENIIFINFVAKNNLLLLLTSNNIIYICEIIDNTLKIKKKLEGMIDNKTQITKSYFCNEDANLILLLCGNGNIIEWNEPREYISHIY